MRRTAMSCQSFSPGTWLCVAKYSNTSVLAAWIIIDSDTRLQFEFVLWNNVHCSLDCRSVFYVFKRMHTWLVVAAMITALRLVKAQ